MPARRCNWTRLTDCDNRAGTCPNADALEALLDAGRRQRGGVADQARSGQPRWRRRAASEDLAQAADARLYDDYTGISLKALATTAGILPRPAAALDPASPPARMACRW